MSTPRDFTAEQWAQIKADRALLAAYIGRVERYPPYPEEIPVHTKPEIKPSPSQLYPRDSSLPLTTGSLLGELRHLEKEVHEHVDKKRVGGKRGGYKGLSIANP